jgi:NADPH:quinone reductase-like Zn-dependent oxidoreductase
MTAMLQATGTMRAAVRHGYCDPAAIGLRTVAKPEPEANEILVRVHAVSVNPADWYGIAGRPLVARPLTGLFRPKEPRIGVDYAGVVEAVGSAVTRFEPGAAVFGGRTGAFAEYVCAREYGGLAPKPENVGFDEAAAVPVAGATALQALRDHGRLERGQRVLVNGAAGGVGTFTVQIAKALGAHVTAVCGTRNVELVRSLGADEVVDSARDDFTSTGEHYDLLVDIASTRSWRALARVVRPDGTIVLVGVPKGRGLAGPIGQMARLRVTSIARKPRFAFFVAKLRQADMEALADMLAGSAIRSVIDREYGFEELGDALAYLGQGHARAKVVVRVRD